MSTDRRRMHSTPRAILHGLIVTALALGAGLRSGRADAQGQPHPQSFTALQPPFTQELFGVTPNAGLQDTDFGILGGVAFAPNGDVWSSECLFYGTTLHRFHLQSPYAANSTTTLHAEELVPTQGGCGLTNHPDGFLYSNSMDGVWRLDAATGLPVAGPVGLAGNALGITVDPQTHHLVYLGAACHPALNTGDEPCTILDLDPAAIDPSAPASGVTVFARVTTTKISYADGIYFDPAGSALFVATRDPAHSLTIVSRPGALGDPATAPINDAQILQQVAMSSEPDGVAFHATDNFVVTLNESDDGGTERGTMTRFDFPNGFGQAPVQTAFASGGFRGDLLQVGGDGCIYATQGPFDDTGGDQRFGTRYDDGTETLENSIVRICGGFAPPPGVPEGDAAPPPTAVNDTATGPEDTPIGTNVLLDDSGDGLTITSHTQGAHGSVVCAAGTCTFTPAANFNGSDTYTYTVTNDGGESVGTVTVTVTPVNDSPVASADSATTTVGTPVVIAVLVNDFDVEGGPLTPVPVSGPSHGTLTLNPDGSLTYTPSAGYSGPDSFTYQSSDGSAGSNVATVSLTVTPAPCPTCQMVGGEPVQLLVNQNVTVDFNPATPVCTGDADLCDPAVFSYVKNPQLPANQWKAIFNSGPRKLVISATVTGVNVPNSGNNQKAPGIELRSTCGLVIAPSGAVVVSSVNQPAGEIRLQVDGDITVDGTIRNAVTGTLGFPGPITIASCCGDIVTGPASRIETLGIDPGGADIKIATCFDGAACQGGDISIGGLVRAVHKYGTTPTISVVAFNGGVTVDGTHDFGNEMVSGTLIRRTSGILVQTLNATSAGNVKIQAKNDITIIGNRILDKNRPQYGAVAIKPNSTNGAGGSGTLKAVSLAGRIVASDRAFDFENRFNALNTIDLQARDGVELSVTASVNDGAATNAKAVVSSQGGDTGTGGTNRLRSFSGGITIGPNAHVLANFTGRPGSVGSNSLTSCLGVSSSGVMNPADGDTSDDVGACATAAPTPMFTSCMDVGVMFP